MLIPKSLSQTVASFYSWITKKKNTTKTSQTKNIVPEPVLFCFYSSNWIIMICLSGISVTLGPFSPGVAAPCLLHPTSPPQSTRTACHMTSFSACHVRHVSYNWVFQGRQKVQLQDPEGHWKSRQNTREKE